MSVLEALGLLAHSPLVWVPALSMPANDGPLASAPSLLELHWMNEVRSPSWRSTALPANTTGVPKVELLLFAGVVISTSGASPTIT